MHQRVQVEICWFIALSRLPASPNSSRSRPGARTYLLGLVKNFSEADAIAIKEIEKTTNHDVKAVEYWIKSKFEARPELMAASEFVHFACTSEDINNTSHALQLKGAREQVHAAGAGRRDRQAARDGRMLTPTCRCSAARTARPPARPRSARKSPTWWCAWPRRASRSPACKLLGKMNGAVGNYNAHLAAWPDFDWEAFSRKVVETPEPLGLGLIFQPYSIQIEPHDYMAELFDAVARANTILIDWSRDIWGYISLGYFKQRLREGEIGSSTMPHKVNPIDFENAEGNLGLANALLRHLSREAADLALAARPDRLAPCCATSAWRSATRRWPITRWRSAWASSNSTRRRWPHDLDASWEVLAEPIQTVMRRFGVQGAYEKLKEVTRGKTVTRRGPARADPLARDSASRKGTAAGHDAGQLHRQSRRTREASLGQALLGAQIHHLQGEPRDRRHRPRLLRGPHADAGAPSERDRRADDDPAGRARASTPTSCRPTAAATPRWPSAPACRIPTTPMSRCATSPARRACGSRSASPRTSPSPRPAARPTRCASIAFNHAAEVWWRGIENKLTRLKNLQRLSRADARPRRRWPRWRSAACNCRPRPGRHADAQRRFEHRRHRAAALEMKRSTLRLARRGPRRSSASGGIGRPQFQHCSKPPSTSSPHTAQPAPLRQMHQVPQQPPRASASCSS